MITGIFGKSLTDFAKSTNYPLLEKQPKDFNRLLKYLEDYSCYAKRRGSDISITTPFSKKAFRLNSLSEEFTIEGIKRQIAEQQKTYEENIITREPKTIAELSKLGLIIDIQNSLKVTESVGYKKWAEKFNLEQMSQTLLFIEKHQFALNELQNIATQKPKTLANIKGEISAVDEKLKQISLLQRHIGTYGKTKEIYKQYRQSKTLEQMEHFKQENTKAIYDHEAAKAYFDEHGYGFGEGKDKLPTVKELQKQYAAHVPPNPCRRIPNGAC